MFLANLALFLLFGQAATAMPSGMANALTKTEISQTPPWQAVCLTGKGNGDAYSDAMKQLADFLVSKGIAPESEFSSTWKAGPDASSPQKDAQWDVCAESTPIDGIQAPFEFKTLPAQDAAHGQCKASLQDLQQCFESLTKFATDNGRSPIAPPRYKRVAGDSETPPTFDIWIPISPAAAAH